MPAILNLVTTLASPQFLRCLLPLLLLLHVVSLAEIPALTIKPLRTLPGSTRWRPLVEGPDGALYGIADRLFRVRRDGAGFTRLEHPPEFTPDIFVFGRDGYIYAANQDSIYRMTLAGRIEVLHTFDRISKSSFANPGWMEVGPDGVIYGTALYAGRFGRGLVYRINLDSTVTILLECASSGLGYPTALARAEDGSLWGIADQPEPLHAGVFRIAPNGAVSYPIPKTDLGYPVDLFAHPDGNLYLFTRAFTGPITDYLQMHRISLNGESVKLASMAVRATIAWERVVLGRDGYFYRLPGSYLERVDTAGTREFKQVERYPGKYLRPMGLTLASDGFLYGALEKTATAPPLLCRMGIGEQGAVNLPPFARPDFAKAPRSGQTITIPILANDRDADGDVLEVTALSAPRAGVATLAPNGRSVLYSTPAGTPVVNDEFVYTLSDGAGGTALGRVVIRPKMTGTFATLLPHSDVLLDGHLTITLTGFGAFTGRLWQGGLMWNLRGVLNDANQVDLPLPGLRGPHLHLALSVESGSPVLEATLTSGETTRSFELSRPNTVAGKAAAGSYTWIIPPEPAWLQEERILFDSDGFAVANRLHGVAGYGIGTMTVLPDGTARFTGRLPDGQPFATRNIIERNGALTLFTGIRVDNRLPFRTRSWFGGWIHLREREGVSDADGGLVWHLPHRPVQEPWFSGSRLTTMKFLASRYAPAGTIASSLGTSQLRLQLAHGGLPAPKTSDVSATGPRLAGSSSISLDALLDPASGTLSGYFRLAGWTHGTALRGVIFPAQRALFGQFQPFAPATGRGTLRATANP